MLMLSSFLDGCGTKIECIYSDTPLRTDASHDGHSVAFACLCGRSTGRSSSNSKASDVKANAPDPGWDPTLVPPTVPSCGGETRISAQSDPSHLFLKGQKTTIRVVHSGES